LAQLAIRPRRLDIVDARLVAERYTASTVGSMASRARFAVAEPILDDRSARLKGRAAPP
jgi:hypothetical protein